MRISSNAEVLPWLLFVMSLPTSKASERVAMWRKLQKFGSLPFRNAGYLLPNSPMNQERFEWMATAIRSFEGEASILSVQGMDDVPARELQEQFRQARSADYENLIAELSKLEPAADGVSIPMKRLKRRYDEILAIDFFESPLRKKAEKALQRAEQPKKQATSSKPGTALKADYQKRLWVTRPRPGIDRVSSAWLISRFIDLKPTFVFSNDPAAHADAVPFDMFQGGGFGHEGEHCTFETLTLAFGIKDEKVHTIAQAIHDADLDDDKFGSPEGKIINQILQGWAKQGIVDDELLRRGMDLIEGLYNFIT